jgi:putative spermidine/putrescine transport system substrate-binding protein
MHVHRMTRWLSTLAAVSLVAAACGSGDPGGDGTDPEANSTGQTAADTVDVDDWDAVLDAADGQTVQWWLFGGDDRINGYIADEVVTRAADLGVTLERVPVEDTGEAVQRVIAERRAGEESGSVDLIWLNGPNFAEGKEAELWREGWAGQLPNAELVDFDDPTIAMDFGVPVDGQEAPWSRAAFVFALDTERTPEPPRSFPELLAYAEDNPGRITYPAPPDFTGSAFVRQAVQALGEDEAFDLLAEMKPFQWREGEAFPGNEAELNQLFGDDQLDLAMSYDPGFVSTAVAQGQFAETARPFLFEGGTLQNVSYVTVPANAGNAAGALVIANLLLEPELQAIKADPEGLGIPSVLDLERLDAEARALFETTAANPYGLTDFGGRLSELPPEQVTEIDERWQDEVLRSGS